MYTLDRKLWLTEDRGRVVEEGDPAARFLLGNTGAQIRDDEAERLGLTGKKAKAAADDKAAEQPAEADADVKAKGAPPETKMMDRAENKAADRPKAKDR